MSSPWKNQPEVVAEKVMKRAAVSQVGFAHNFSNHIVHAHHTSRWLANYRIDLRWHNSKRIEAGRTFPWIQLNLGSMRSYDNEDLCRVEICCPILPPRALLPTFNMAIRELL